MKETFVEGLPLKFKPTKWILNKYEKINHFNKMSIKEMDGYCEANGMAVTIVKGRRHDRGDVKFLSDEKGWRDRI